MPRTVYVESTIPNAYYSTRPEPKMAARRAWTREWWDEHRHAYHAVTSRATLEEVSRGLHLHKEEKVALVRELPFLPNAPATANIVAEYIRRMVMPQDPTGDALHLALASYYACDFLLTWNIRHLANANKFEHIERVNAELGLSTPRLITPMELTGGT